MSVHERDKMEAEVCHDVVESQGILAASRGWNRQGMDFPHSPRNSGFDCSSVKPVLKSLSLVL